MKENYYYNPKIFDTNSIEEAKNIILTKEDGVDTEERWDKETLFLTNSISDFLKINEKMLILDYGCGIGRLSKKLIDKFNCKVIGVDISSSMREKAIKYVNHDNFKVVSPNDLRGMIIDGFKVDAAICLWVLQHCIEPFVDIILIKNVIKKDALFYVLNNKISAVPTNKGWINNGINLHELLKLEFEELNNDVLPISSSSKKISENTFISFLKNNKGTIFYMSEEEKSLAKEALSSYENKEFKKAQEIYIKILKNNPKSVESHANIGVIYKTLGDTQKAIYHYIEVIKLNPKHIMTYNNLGNAFKDIKNYKMSIQAFHDCIKLDKNNYNTYNNLAMVYENMNQLTKALQCYKKAIELNPKYTKAINNIAVVLYKQKKYKEAIEVFKIALQVDPKYYEVYSNLGATYNKNKDHDNAIKYLKMAIEYLPNHAGAYTNLGNVYNKLYDYKTAVKYHEKSIALDPTGSNAHSNIGTSYKYLSFSKKSIESYKKAIELNPDFENAHFDLATMYLAKEDFKNGWKEYEWRFKKEEMISHMIMYKEIFSKTMLKRDMNIEGKTLLLHSEQGFGDSIEFIRFLPLLKEKYKCKIAVKCRDELTNLFKSIPQIDILTNRSEQTPTFDYHIPIMSIPYILDMKSFNDLPKQYPYLFAQKDKEFEIKKEKSKINIGICWSASVTGESYDGKVFDLKYLEPFINSNRVNVYSLQVGAEKEDIKKLSYENKIIDITDKLSDFSKTASLMMELDLVISSDTSVAHLAGALNVPVWIPLQKIPDWRWGNKGESTKWYPSAKLFRQKTNRVWAGVFQSIVAKFSKQYKIKLK